MRQDEDITDSGGHGTAARGALALGALGVVFGDIGTSPLYAVQTVFNPADPHPVAAAAANVYLSPTITMRLMPNSSRRR